MRISAAWRRAAGMALIAAAVFYLGRTISVHWQDLAAFEWRVRPGLFAASVAAHVAVLAWGVWVWSRILRRFDHPRIGVSALLPIWFLSNLARYVPGKIFQFVAAAHLSRAAGLSPAVMLTAMLVHVGLALLSAVVVAAWTLSGGLLPGVHPVWLVAIASGGALIAVHPAVLDRAVGIAPRLLGRDLIRWTGSWSDGLVVLALSIVSWLLYGGAYHLFLASVADVPWRLLPQMVGVNSLSFFVGFVSVLPGGIGLREVAMAELLRPYTTPGVGAILAIAARLWTVVAELIGGGLALLATRRSTPPVPIDLPGA